MSYPYTNQGFTESKKGFNTGRVLFVEDPTNFTPREFLKFMNEGFVPIMATSSDSGTGTRAFFYEFINWTFADGVYTLGDGAYISADLDMPYGAAGAGHDAGGELPPFNPSNPSESNAYEEP